ncbi:c-Myc-binding protein-like isoform X1 [Simochromis diagramma]|uniref:c-Myc-binding protein-like isoform X1 n=1 Tax=Simochromis diagramma TaxID=43689 RepID=UPI001A7EFC2D|nr:c-Myc-binding protein-like isoform X1 [Simochromis diagramma]
MHRGSYWRGQGPDPKREQFRRYLEKAGVVDSLTSVLVSLYEQQEKPNNALEFVKQQLGAVGQTSEDAEALQQEVINLRQKCARLAGENKELKAKEEASSRTSLREGRPSAATGWSEGSFILLPSLL